MKILIAVPTFENVSVDTFKSIYSIRRDDADFACVKGYDCAKARNEIAKKAVAGKYDYVLMVDSDIVLPKNTFDCLLEVPVDICLGVYPHRNTKKREAEIFKRGTFDFVNRYSYDELTINRITVKGGGLGCALIDVKVFSKLKYPWFKYVVYENGSALGEDLYFCSSANKADLTIEADTRVKCGHISKNIQYE